MATKYMKTHATPLIIEKMQTRCSEVISELRSWRQEDKEASASLG